MTFDYDNANRRTKLTYPSGTSTEYAYDNASRLTGLTYKHGGNTLGLTYTYDLASHSQFSLRPSERFFPHTTLMIVLAAAVVTVFLWMMLADA